MKFTSLAFPKKRLIEYNGQTLGVNEWAKRIGINQATLSERLSKGWLLEKALGPKTRYTHKLNEPTKCTKCGRTYSWSVEYFTPRRRNKLGGCEQPCRSCNKDIRAKSDRRKASRKAYYKLHHDEALSYAKQWYRDNAIRARAKTKRYYEENRELRIEAVKRWMKAHPLVQRLHYQRRRLKIAESCGQLNRHDIDLQYKNQKGRCWWCNIKLREKYHLDHCVPLSRGGLHDRRNIVISCPKCNLTKGNKLPYEFCGRLL
jgi:hypothetical protein